MLLWQKAPGYGTIGEPKQTFAMGIGIRDKLSIRTGARSVLATQPQTDEIRKAQDNVGPTDRNHK